MQVEPNAHKIEEHRRKYERMRKDRELKRAERERQKRQAARVSDSVNLAFTLFRCRKNYVVCDI